MAIVVRKNSKAYDSGDVDVVLLGAKVDDVRAIEYSIEQEHQLNYSVGRNEGTTWSRGKKTYTASITVGMQDATAIEKAAQGDLLAIAPFDINVTYNDEYNYKVNDTITCKFMKQGRSVNEGDMGLSYQYDLFVIGIQFRNE